MFLLLVSIFSIPVIGVTQNVTGLFTYTPPLTPPLEWLPLIPGADDAWWAGGPTRYCTCDAPSSWEGFFHSALCLEPPYCINNNAVCETSVYGIPVDQDWTGNECFGFDRPACPTKSTLFPVTGTWRCFLPS
jgi:hypothetical protein